MDDEIEAVEFINDQIKNSRAYVMNVDPSEVEIDSSPLKGSSVAHEFRYCALEFHYFWQKKITYFRRYYGKEGQVAVRDFPCFCNSCLCEDYNSCERSETVGPWIYHTLVSKGSRPQKNVRYRGGVQRAPNAKVPEEIIGSRLFEGMYQYEVQWVGEDAPTWHAADTLPFSELIDEYEAKRM